MTTSPLDQIDLLYEKFANLASHGQVKRASRLAIRLQDLIILTLKKKPELALYRKAGEVADFLYSQRLYQHAKSGYESLLRFRRKHPDFDVPSVPSLLNALGTVHFIGGHYEKARRLHEKALKEYQRHDDEPPAAVYYNLADCYLLSTNYRKAEQFMKKALIFAKKESDVKPLQVAKYLNALGLIYWSKGDYARAKPLFWDSMKSYGKEGDTHREALCLNNLGLIDREFGLHADSKEKFKKATEMLEKLSGSSDSLRDSDLERVCNNLGLACLTLGQTEEAEFCLKQTLEENHPQKDTIDAAFLLNIAEAYAERNPEKTVLYLNQALQNQKRGRRIYHPLTAKILKDLALMSHYHDYQADTMDLLKRALRIQKKVLSPDHMDIADTHYLLALVYSERGENLKATRPLKKAAEICKKKFPSDHEKVLAAVRLMAEICLNQGLTGKALQYFVETQEKETTFIYRNAEAMSGPEGVDFIKEFGENLNQFLSLVAQYASKDIRTLRKALTIVFRRKGTILELQRHFQEAIFNISDIRTKRLSSRLNQARSRLSMLAMTYSNEIQLEQFAELEQEERMLEAKLREQSPPFQLNSHLKNVTCEQVAGVMPVNSVLIEYVKTDTYDFEDRTWGPPHYLAFLLKPRKVNAIRLVDLGTAEDIDDLLLGLRKRIEDGLSLYDLSKKLCSAVFAPLIKDIGQVDTIFLSPDGDLNLVPFEILLSGNDRYLIEDYAFNYLSNGKELLGLSNISEPTGKAILMGNPAFDSNLKVSKKPKNGRTRSEYEELCFGSLKGSEEEVRQLAEIVGKGSRIFIGREAQEKVLRRLRKPPLLLHLATHGFFFPETDTSEEKPEANPLTRSGFLPRRLIPTVTSPLLRSGIALAGFNVSIKSGISGENDGVVTARDFLSFRLRGTEMVTLSACFTGLGEVKTGEGVFGLRRALSQVGAKSLVMSMWDIPDKETRELMTEFYKNVFEEQMNKCQALRKAVLSQLEKHRKDPRLWGGFIFAGNPASVDRK